MVVQNVTKSNLNFMEPSKVGVFGEDVSVVFFWTSLCWFFSVFAHSCLTPTCYKYVFSFQTDSLPLCLAQVWSLSMGSSVGESESVKERVNEAVFES